MKQSSNEYAAPGLLRHYVPRNDGLHGLRWFPNENNWEEGMSAVRIVIGAWAVATGIALSHALAQAPAAPTPANPWATLAPFPDASEEVLGAVANGKLYVFCGLGPNWTPKALVYEYDPATNNWTRKKPMQLPSHHVAFAALNDKIYAFGGFTLPYNGPPAWRPLDNAWEYDPAADSWKALAPMPTKRGAAGAAIVNGKIYVVGGANSLPGVTEAGIHPARPHHVVATVEEHAPAAGRCSPRATITRSPRSGTGSTPSAGASAPRSFRAAATTSTWWKDTILR